MITCHWKHIEKQRSNDTGEIDTTVHGEGTFQAKSELAAKLRATKTVMTPEDTDKKWKETKWFSHEPGHFTKNSYDHGYGLYSNSEYLDLVIETPKVEPDLFSVFDESDILEDEYEDDDRPVITEEPIEMLFEWTCVGGHKRRLIAEPVEIEMNNPNTRNPDAEKVTVKATKVYEQMYANLPGIQEWATADTSYYIPGIKPNRRIWNGDEAIAVTGIHPEIRVAQIMKTTVSWNYDQNNSVGCA